MTAVKKIPIHNSKLSTTNHIIASPVILDQNPNATITITKTIIAAKFRYPTKLRRPPNSVISTLFDRVERDIENVLNDIYKIAFHHLR